MIECLFGPKSKTWFSLVDALRRKNKDITKDYHIFSVFI